jgi:hypothetical protein
MKDDTPNDRGPPRNPAAHRRAAKRDPASGQTGGDFARWRNGQASELEAEFQSWRQNERRRHAEAFEAWREDRNAHGKDDPPVDQNKARRPK